MLTSHSVSEAILQEQENSLAVLCDMGLHLRLCEDALQYALYLCIPQVFLLHLKKEGREHLEPLFSNSRGNNLQMYHLKCLFKLLLHLGFKTQINQNNLINSSNRVLFQNYTHLTVKDTSAI